MSPTSQFTRPTHTTQPSVGGTTPGNAKATSSVNFDDLWSMSLGTGSSAAKKAPVTTGAKSIKDLEKEKAQAGIWGNSGTAQNKPMGMGLFGATSGGSAGAGGDDLLL